MFNFDLVNVFEALVVLIIGVTLLCLILTEKYHREDQKINHRSANT